LNFVFRLLGRRGLYLIRFSLAAGVFYVLYLEFPFDSFADEIHRLKYFPLFMAFLGFSIIQFILAFRFYLVLSAIGLKLPISHIIHLHFVSLFFNTFLPGAVGGDVAKSYYLRTSSDHWGKGFLAVLTDRFIGMVSLASLGLTAAAIVKTPAIGGIAPAFWILGGLICSYATLYILQVERIRALLCRSLKRFTLLYSAARVVDEALQAARRPRLLFLGGILSFAYFLVFAGIHLFIGWSIGIELEYWNTVYIIILIALFSSIPIIPGGHGQRESAYVFLFSAYGLTKDQSFFIAAVALGMLILMAFIGGIFFLSGKKRYQKSGFPPQATGSQNLYSANCKNNRAMESPGSI